VLLIERAAVELLDGGYGLFGRLKLNKRKPGKTIISI
jgi:hypothetical protein